MPETHGLIQNAAWGGGAVEIRALHYLSKEGPAPLRLSRREQIADVLFFPGEDVIVESLFFVSEFAIQRQQPAARMLAAV